MKFALLLIFSCILSVANAQQHNANIQQQLSDYTSAVQRLKQFEALGVKHPGSMEIEKTRDWIVQFYKAHGYTSIHIDSFKASGYNQQNVVVKKSGIMDDYIVVGSHYDSKNGPGVNDNGTGVSAAMQVAEILKPLVINRTVYFVHFSAEEDGFWGSYHFVEEVLPTLPGTLYAMLNLDQLGGTLGFAGNDKIYCERDEIAKPSTNNAASFKIADTIANLAKLYTSLTPVISAAYSSDYIPFQENNHVIAGIFQFGSCPYTHTADDLFKYMDTISFVEAVKLSVATVLHFAQVPQFVSVLDVQKPSPILRTLQGEIYINMNDLPSEMFFTLYDITGKIVHSEPIFSNKKINITHVKTGIYTAVLSAQNSSPYFRSMFQVP